MYDKSVVLCSSSKYTKKFYLNPEFDNLPQQIKDELKITCVLFTEDIGGVIMFMYNKYGSLEIIVEHEEDDFLYDEIGSALKIKQIQKHKSELFEQLEEYYDTFFGDE